MEANVVNANESVLNAKLANEQHLITILFGACLVLVMLLIGGAYFVNKAVNTLKTKVDKFEAIEQELVNTKNKLNQNISKIEVLTSENDALFTKIHSSDATINHLQAVIKEYEKKIGDLNTALTISDETVIDLKDSIENKITGYSTIIDTAKCPVRYPIYSNTFKDKDDWFKGNISMGKNVFDLHIVSRNAYDVTIGEEKVSLFKKKLFANVTNLNPNTETKTLQVYQKEEVKRGIFKPLGIGTAVGLVVGYFIFK